MIKVDSRPTMRLVTKRFMQMNRGRNLVAILAIIITTILFMSVSTAVSSLIISGRQHQSRLAMDSSHFTIQNMTKEQFQKMTQSEIKGAERYGYTIFLSLAENEALEESQTEIRYASENGADSFMCRPTKGRLPQFPNEIALSTITLEQLGVPQELGSAVTLEFTADGRRQSADFVLSGYWTGDTLAMAQEAWVSQSFVLEHAKKAEKTAIELGDYEGEHSIFVWCSNSLGIRKTMEWMEEQYDISSTQARMSINPAFDLFGEDGFPVGTVMAVLFLIFLSGYLIIFNVFHISVRNDIRTYGLLKNIGTTGRQIKSIVRRQALTLSAIGIPVGLLIGYVTGRSMTPYLLEDHTGEVQVQAVFTANPFIFVAAAIFSLITVYIGCQRPGQLVAKISPVEAVRLTGQTEGKKRKKTGKISAVRMGAENLRRAWKKEIVVMISLTLPIIILNAIGSIVKGFHPEVFVEAYISSDFKISGCNHDAKTSDLNAMTPEIMKQIRQREEVEEIFHVYDTEIRHRLTEDAYERLDDIISRTEKEEAYSLAWMQQERSMLESRLVPGHVMGIDKQTFAKMIFEEADMTWEEFQSGNYVIVGTGVSHYGWGTYYDPGDKVTLEVGNGKEKEYTVLGIGELPYDLEYPFGCGTNYDYTFYLPAEEYLSQGGNEGAMAVGINVEDGKDRQFNQWISHYIEETGVKLYVDSKLELEKQCAAFVNKYYVILGILGGVLFLIGILNFFNTISVSVISRRRELSLLEAVGMTRKQVLRMLITEGMIYFIAAFFIADTIGALILKPLILKTVGRAFFFSEESTILPSVLAIPVFVLIAVAIPVYHYYKMRKETVVERLVAE